MEPQEESEVKAGGRRKWDRYEWGWDRREWIKGEHSPYFFIYQWPPQAVNTCLPATIFYPCTPNHRSQQGLFMGQRMPRYGHVPSKITIFCFEAFHPHLPAAWLNRVNPQWGLICFFSENWRVWASYQSTWLKSRNLEKDDGDVPVELSTLIVTGRESLPTDHKYDEAS